MRTKKVLYPTDFSRTAHAALPLAIECAERFLGELHVLHAVLLHEAEPLASTNFTQTEELLQRAAVRLVRAHRRGLSAGSVILNYAREAGVDLVVIGTHGRTGLSHLLFGSVAAKVVRSAGCPVFTVGLVDGRGTPGDGDHVAAE